MSLYSEDISNNTLEVWHLLTTNHVVRALATSVEGPGINADFSLGNPFCSPIRKCLPTSLLSWEDEGSEYSKRSLGNLDLQFFLSLILGHTEHRYRNE